MIVYRPRSPLTAALEQAAVVGQRATRRRHDVHHRPCHVPPDMAGIVIRDVAVGAAGVQCLPPRTRCIEISDEWVRCHHGLVATVSLAEESSGRHAEGLQLTLHAPEGDVRYIQYRWDRAQERHHLRRIDQ